ncbi:unnamed protein product [Heterobilharzia americana]|nr:unnamed protein product [Heterobilharzia americana]
MAKDLVLDEDKRLAKRRLIEANRARKRAEAAAAAAAAAATVSVTSTGIVSISEPSNNISSVINPNLSSTYQVLYNQPTTVMNNLSTPVIMSAIPHQPTFHSNILFTNQFTVNSTPIEQYTSITNQTYPIQTNDTVYPTINSSIQGMIHSCLNEKQLPSVSNHVYWQPIYTNSNGNCIDNLSSNNIQLTSYSLENNILLNAKQSNEVEENQPVQRIESLPNTIDNHHVLNVKTINDEIIMSKSVEIDEQYKSYSSISLDKNQTLSNNNQSIIKDDTSLTKHNNNNNNCFISIDIGETLTNDCPWTIEDNNMIESIVQAYSNMLNTNFQQKDNSEDVDKDPEKVFYTPTDSKITSLIEPMIASLVAFARLVPGFELLDANDQTRLLRGCCLDIITLRAAYLLSRIAISLGIIESNGYNKTQFMNTTVLDSTDPISVSSTTSNQQHGMITIIPNNIYPQLGTSNAKCAQMIRGVALKLARLEIDQTEVALMTAILLMSPDRFGLTDCETVEHTQDILLETFNRYANRIRKLRSLRFQSNRPLSNLHHHHHHHHHHHQQQQQQQQQQHWPRILMALTELRSITLCNQGLFVEKAYCTTIEQLPWYFRELFAGDFILQQTNRFN